MFVIGITGGIGSGKSEATKQLQELGASVINADLVGHQVYAPNTDGWREVVAAFGQEVVAADGTIDRRKLGPIVFADPKHLTTLNLITHPKISAMIKAQLDDLRAKGSSAAVVEAALFIEARWTHLVNELWTVVASEKAVVQRVMARSGLTEADVLKRIRSQMSNEERRRHAHVVIENEGTLEDLQRRVRELWAERVQPGLRKA